MATLSTKQEVVAQQPKLFVGQIPADAEEETVSRLFSGYGTVKGVSVPRKPNSSESRRFAIVEFSSWAEAEAATDALHGQTSLGGDKPLVVRFADPPRTLRPEGSKGICAKKLFVGQIPQSSSEHDVRAWFEPFGEIESFALKQNESSASIAFVTYATWRAAEEAIGAMHDHKPSPGARHGLVVKFADAKPQHTAKASDVGAGVGMKRGFESDGGAMQKRHNMGMMGPSSAMQVGMGSMGRSMMGMASAGMSSMAVRASPVPIDRGMGLGMRGGRGMGMASGYDAMPRMIGMGYRSMGRPGGRAMGVGMGVGMGGYAMSGGMVERDGYEWYDDAYGYPGGGYGGYSDYAADPGDGGYAHPGLAGDRGLNAARMGMQGMRLGGSRAAAAEVTPAAWPQYDAYPPVQAAAQRPSVRPALPAAAPGSTRACPWKLFVGQLPYDASEDDVYSFFTLFGDIVDAMVLRKRDGSSQGCGFVTYASAEQAAHAIATVNGKLMLPGSSRPTPLICRYANSARG